MDNFLYQLSTLILKYRKSIFFLWLILLVSTIFFLANSNLDIPEDKMQGAFDTDSYRVEQIMEHEFGYMPEMTAAVVVEKKVTDNSIKELLQDNFPEIVKIIEMENPKSADTTLYYLEYEINTSLDHSQGLIKGIREKLDLWERKTGINTYVTGHAAFFHDMKTASTQDASNNEKIAVVVAFFILVFNYGGIITAFLPILIGATTILFMKALVLIFGFEVNPISETLNTMVGLALAIDYSLFLVNRFKEEINHKSEGQALAVTLKNAGETILFSAVIMIFSIAILYIPEVTSSRVVVKSLIVVVLLSCINALLFLPAFLIFGQKLLDKPLFLTNLIKKTDTYNFWKKFSHHVVTYPKSYFIASSLVLLAISAPALNIRLWEPIQTLTPKHTESIKGYERLEQDGWGGELIPVNILVEVPENVTVFNRDSLSFIYDFSKALEKHELVNSVQSIASWNKSFNPNDYHTFYSNLYNIGFLTQDSLISNLVNVSGKSNYTIINVFPKDLMNIHGTYRIIDFAKEYAAKHREFKVLVGGTVVRSNDFTREIYGHLPLMFILIFGGIFIILFFYMRAVVLPIKAAIMNFLPILSAFGILTMVFQYGFLSEILQTPHNNAVTSLVPIILFCIIFGLSMDYEVLILSRITEFYRETGDVKFSVVEGLARSGSVITGAALILMGVFFPGIFASSPIVKEMCIGITAAILIDATIVRLFLVPSFMVLMGKWNWWNPLKKL